MTRKTLSNVPALLGVGLVLSVTFVSVILYRTDMMIEVNGLRSTEGVIHVLVYDNATAFEEGSLFDLAGFTTSEVLYDTMTVALSCISPGDYAVMVHHDENANDVFEHRGAIPLEGWGYSNNVGVLDLPTFAAATVSISDTTPPLKLDLVYAN